MISNFLSSREENGVPNVRTPFGQTISLDESFTKVKPSTIVTPRIGGAPGASGVTAAVLATNGGIGYVDGARARLIASKRRADFVDYATVDGFDPITNLPEAAASLPVSSLLLADQTMGVFAAAPRPPIEPVTPSCAAGCLLLADPAKYARPSRGYPIIGISYLLFSSQGNAAEHLDDLRNLGQFLTRSASYTGQDPIDRATRTRNTGRTGYATLPLSRAAGGIAATIQEAATRCFGP